MSAEWDGTTAGFRIAINIARLPELGEAALMQLNASNSPIERGNYLT